MNKLFKTSILSLLFMFAVIYGYCQPTVTGAPDTYWISAVGTPTIIDDGTGGYSVTVALDSECGRVTTYTLTVVSTASIYANTDINVTLNCVFAERDWECKTWVYVNFMLDDGLGNLTHDHTAIVFIDDTDLGHGHVDCGKNTTITQPANSGSDGGGNSGGGDDGSDDGGSDGSDDGDGRSTIAPSIGTDFKVYPNPTGDQTFVELNVTEANSRIEVLVTDITGKVVLSKAKTIENTGTLQFRMDIGALSPGVYHIQANVNGKQKQVQKLIKQ